jgi:hypothetical protein
LARIAGLCEAKALAYLAKIDKKTLAFICAIARKQNEVFGFSEDFLSEMDRMTTEGDDVRRVILNPLLDDLLGDNVYKLQWKDATLCVPLWHNEMVFDISGQELEVCCSPILPANVDIDENNQILVHIEVAASTLLDAATLDVPYFSQLKIDPSELKWTRAAQCFEFREKGILAMNTANVYDDSIRRSIFAIVRLV